MADNVQFKTGGTSLPTAITNGAIYIVQNGKLPASNYYKGDIYFDSGSNRYLLTNNPNGSTRSSSTSGLDYTLKTKNGYTWAFTVPFATSTAVGIVSKETQSFAGPKTFIDSITISNTTNTLDAKLTVDGKAVIGKLNLSNSNGISYGTEDPPTDNVSEGDVYFKLI